MQICLRIKKVLFDLFNIYKNASKVIILLYCFTDRLIYRIFFFSHFLENVVEREKKKKQPQTNKTGTFAYLGQNFDLEDFLLMIATCCSQLVP